MTTMQGGLVIQPMQWVAMRELGDTPPLDATDHACMIELRDVLERHGKLVRFALHLAHKHFDLAAGEVLVERSDPDGRAQTVTVGQLDQVGEAVPTTWMLTAAADMLAINTTYCVCAVPPGKSECGTHGKGSSAPELPEGRIRDRRIAEERAAYERGGPVAGHNFEQERGQ